MSPDRTRTPTASAPARLPAPLCTPACAPVFEAANVPLFLELRAPWEWMELHLSRVYYGDVRTRGSGSPVVVVPGFLSSDLHLQDLRLWLARIGYRPISSDIGRNADCPDLLLERLLETLDDAHREVKRPIQLVGHSFGGVLAWAAAARRPGIVSQVIALGAPLNGLRAHRRVLDMARMLAATLPPPRDRPRRHGDHSHATECACEFLKDGVGDTTSGPHLVSVYSKSDGVVDWRTCLAEPPAENVQVHGSHLGLVMNRHVYEILGARLSAGEAAASRIGAAA